jgi:hypothetical protein
MRQTRTSGFTKGESRCLRGASIPVNRSHLSWVLLSDQVNGNQDQCVKKGLTIGMKHIRKHFASSNVLLANYIFITTVKYAEGKLPVNETSTSTYLSEDCLASKTDLMPNNSLHIESAVRMNDIFSGSCFSLIILFMIYPDITQIYVYVNGKLGFRFLTS